MALLDFFKSNKKAKTESVKTKKPSPEHLLFADCVLEIISPSVESFGFVRFRTEIETHIILNQIEFAKDSDGNQLKIVGHQSL